MVAMDRMDSGCIAHVKNSFVIRSDSGMKQASLLRFRGQVLRRPLAIIFGRMHVQPTLHSRMTEAAKLCAGKLVSSRFGGFEPGENRSPRDGILLEAQVRNEQAMNNISRPYVYANDLVRRHMNIVVELNVIFTAQFAVRPRIGNLPIKLLGCNTDFEVRGR